MIHLGRCFFAGFIFATLAVLPEPAADPDTKPWVLAHAYKVPSEYTNQESGYFSIVDGRNGRLYIGAAKYGVDAYLIEFDPMAEAIFMSANR